MGVSTFANIALLNMSRSVTGKAREHDIVYFAPTSRAQIDHFVEVNKMIGNAIFAGFTGDLGLYNDIDFTRKRQAPSSPQKQTGLTFNNGEFAIIASGTNYQLPPLTF